MGFEKIDIENLSIVKLEFYTGDIPPPYCFTFQILIDFNKGLLTDFELKYLEREDITEAEILEAGYSLNDDYKWKGSLNNAWVESLKETLSKTMWSAEKKTRAAEETSIRISLMDKSSKAFDGTPANNDVWEHFCQEIMQAVFEISKKESPLHIQYLEIGSQGTDLNVDIDVRFADRCMSVKKDDRGTVSEKTLSWSKVKDTLKYVYIPDFDYALAKSSTPKKKGRYLNTGEGLWFEFGKSAINPSKKVDVLSTISKLMNEL